HAQHLRLAGRTVEGVPPGVVVLGLPPRPQPQHFTLGTLLRFADLTFVLVRPPLSQLSELELGAFAGRAHLDLFVRRPPLPPARRAPPAPGLLGPQPRQRRADAGAAPRSPWRPALRPVSWTARARPPSGGGAPRAPWPPPRLPAWSPPRGRPRPGGGAPPSL